MSKREPQKRDNALRVQKDPSIGVNEHIHLRDSETEGGREKELDSVGKGLVQKNDNGNNSLSQFKVTTEHVKSLPKDFKGMIWSILFGGCLNYTGLKKHLPM